MQIKRVVKNLLFLLIAVALSLFVLELVFRIARHEDALRLTMGQADPKYHHSLKPNTDLHLVSSVSDEYDVMAHINNHGFRGPDIEVEKKANQKRIFIVGDSFAFGSGSNDYETIPAQLQKILDPSSGQIQVVNAGRGSYSPLTYYLRLRDEVPKFKPDLVVMMLDFSDLRDDWDGEKNLLYDQHGNIVASNPYYEYGKFKLWNFLRSKSVMCMYLHNKVVRTFQKVRKLGFRDYLFARMRGMRIKAAIATTKSNTIEFDGRLFMRGKEKAEEIEGHFQRTAKYILMSRSLVQEHGGKFILIMYPYGIYVGPDQWSEGRVFWGFEKGRVYSDLFAFDLVREFARESNIPFVNLLEDFIRHKDEQLFFSYDGHFTPRANRLVAEALARHPIFLEALNQG